MKLSTSEFVRRWCLHIQPHQLTKTRCFGGWSNSRREAYLAKMQSAYDMIDGSPVEEPSAEVIDSAASLCCEHCGGESLTLIGQERKPSWSVLLRLDSECSPWWYQASQELEEKRLWDAAMGEGFYAWYVAHVLRPSESAREIEPPYCRSPKQLLLPGLDDVADKAGTYYANSL